MQYLGSVGDETVPVNKRKAGIGRGNGTVAKLDSLWVSATYLENAASRSDANPAETCGDVAEAARVKSPELGLGISRGGCLYTDGRLNCPLVVVK